MTPHTEPSTDGTVPSIWSFMERPLWRVALESVLGATAGALLAEPLGLEPQRGSLVLAGAVLAPTALLLTPVLGGVGYRGLRYGLALAVLVTLVVSFSGEGRARPIAEVLTWGLGFLVLGSVAHAIMLVALPAPFHEQLAAPGQDPPEDGQDRHTKVE